MKTLFFLILTLVSGTALSAQQDTTKTLPESHERWHTPQKLSPENTKVTFELDSTWHTVHGKVGTLSGTLELKDKNDPQTVRVESELIVGSFDTGSGSRDSKMRDVMGSEDFPVVKFEVDGLSKKCTPALVFKSGKCDDIMDAKLTIRDVAKKYHVPVHIESAGEAFVVKGELPVSWMEFGVEDPSILIASVDPVVTIFFEVTLNPQS